MCIVLHGQVLRSTIVNRKPRQKMLLLTLADFAKQPNFDGYIHYETASKYIGVGPEQIRRMMRQLEARDILAIEDTRGRGKSPRFQLNMPLINEEEKTPPTGGLLQKLKPHLFLGKTPPLPQENPTSIGGPIYSQSYNKGARLARDTDLSPPNGVQSNGREGWNPPTLPSKPKGRAFLKSAKQEQGDSEALEMLEGARIDQDNSGEWLFLVMASASQVEKVRQAFPKSLLEHGLSVVCPKSET